jgi:hypothetical protein
MGDVPTGDRVVGFVPVGASNQTTEAAPSLLQETSRSPPGRGDEAIRSSLRGHSTPRCSQDADARIGQASISAMSGNDALQECLDPAHEPGRARWNRRQQFSG